MVATKTLKNRYRLIAPIGEGGMGAVYLAEDKRLPGRQCAVKELRVPADAAGASLAELRTRLMGEAAILARLDHPALPGVSDYFDADGRIYLVMDYVPGQDLRALAADARRRGRHLDEAQVVRWAEDLCAALGYLHAQEPPVVHRDIKPANIKLTPDGQIRLVDFGLAQPIAADDGPTVTFLAGAGSRPYQPLEQYGDGGRVDARSDLYALGATLYHLLAGHAPASAQERFLDPACLRPPREERPELSQSVEAAVLAAMALHPDQRPPTAEVFRRLLVAPAAAGRESSRGARTVRAMGAEGAAGVRSDASGDLATSWSGAVRANVWLMAVVLMLLLAALVLSLRP